MIQPLCDSYVEVTSSNAAQRAHLQWASRCHKVAKHLDPWNTLGTEDCALLAESYYRQLGLWRGPCNVILLERVAIRASKSEFPR